MIGTARSLEKARQVCEQLPGEALALSCDLSEPDSILRCAASVADAGHTLSGVICNAGVMALPQLQLAHGYEAQFLTNHIGHFLLVTHLLDALSKDARIVVVSSSLHRRAPAVGVDFDNLRGERRYDAWEAYARSKLANLLFAKQLARRFAGSERTANAVHPGVIRTELQRHLPAVAALGMRALSPIALKTVAQGAATQVYVATRPELATTSGQYFADCNLAAARPDSDDEALAEKLWDTSVRITKELAFTAP